MSDFNENIAELRKSVQNLQSSFDLDERLTKLKSLEAKSVDPTFWDDQDVARGVMQEIADLRSDIDEMKELEEGLLVIEGLVSEGADEKEFSKEVEKLEAVASGLKLKSYLSAPYDKKNAIISIHAGQGGVEAMDWANMLYRMYLRFCEKRDWKTETIETSEGEEAGIKSVTFKVYGSFAYGYLKGEVGTHRLVRLSPFNADNLRQTSFALVGVLPELAETDLPEIKITDEDLDWQFFHSSSQGGQNVQKVSTAVRVKHIPTGLTVTAQTERFQEQNRKIALELLRAKLWLLSQEQKEREVKEIKGEYRPASWGNQIRNYVLHPYKMVKDLRTGVETSNPEAVLNGEIGEFIESELKLKKE